VFNEDDCVVEVDAKGADGATGAFTGLGCFIALFRFTIVPDGLISIVL
jgi:hypothetical protein